MTTAEELVKALEVEADRNGVSQGHNIEAMVAARDALLAFISDETNRATQALDGAIKLADMSVQDIKLMAGEMTAAELRTVRAVVKGIVARLTALREATK